MWKDFFYFTKTERRGIIVLVVLILVACAAFWLFPADWGQEVASADEEEQFKEDYKEFIASLREVKREKNYNRASYPGYTKREVVLSQFDPNMADSITFLDLGLPPWMAKNILNYRRKQGKFRNPEDFRKIYGLTETQYQTLLPYIRIAKEIAEKDTIRLLVEKAEKHDSIFKYKSGTLIDLNRADTTELKKIPGIGSSIAQRIVNYRKRLGAFCQIEQLQEIHLKADKLRSWFTIDTNQIPCININKASIERLMNHPYINFYQARVIVEYRKKKGRLDSLKQLSLYEEFTPEDFERIRPYICFD